MLRAGNGTGYTSQGTGWDSQMHHPAAKPTHRDPHQHLLWQQEPAHPRCQRSYPKKCLSRAAAPLGCKQCVPQESWCSAYPLPSHPHPPQKGTGTKSGCASATAQPDPRQLRDILHQKGVENTSWAQHLHVLLSLCSTTNCSSDHSYPHSLPF